MVTSNGHFAYAANAGIGNISGFSVSSRGKLSLLNSDGITGVTGNGSHPVDMSLSSGDNFLYVLDSGTQMITAFAASTDGSLALIANFAAPSNAASGLAAH
jgi:6-phosphogluconolactonase (cycloisomerase 2 family)